jgi:hypothetical protein
MNIFVPAALGVAAISFVANFLAPPIMVALTPPQPPPSDVIHCEGYYPPTEDCIPLGTTRPSWFKKKRSNAGCPQWQINKQWGERGIFVSKLKDMEAIAKEFEQILAEVTPDDAAKLGGEDALKPLIWIRRERGVAWSRMQDGIIAGNSEFHSGDECWTDALLPLYVEEFGVKPSEDFIEFVTAFDVKNFKEQLTTLRQTMAAQL